MCVLLNIGKRKLCILYVACLQPVVKLFDSLTVTGFVV